MIPQLEFVVHVSVCENSGQHGRGKEKMPASLKIKDQDFIWGARTYIMGFLNLTPDSFSGDGLFKGNSGVTDAVSQASRFVEAGADLLDIGGESTGPGAVPVPVEGELQRVIPVVQALSAEFEAIKSIDTYNASVAAAALDAGAHLVNDIWGMRADPGMAALVARRKVPVILIHNRSQPANPELQEHLGGRLLVYRVTIG